MLFFHYAISPPDAVTLPLVSTLITPTLSAGIHEIGGRNVHRFFTYTSTTVTPPPIQPLSATIIYSPPLTFLKNVKTVINLAY